MKIKRNAQGDVVIKLENDEEFAWLYAISSCSTSKAEKWAKTLGVSIGEDSYLAQDALHFGLKDLTEKKSY